MEWLSLRETGADEQGNQLTAEENPDVFFFFLILFIKQKYVTIITMVHLDKCSCIGH